MGSFEQLKLQVGVEGIPAFRSAFKDAIEVLDQAGNRATQAGEKISRAFKGLGVEDSASQFAAQVKKIQTQFELLDKAFDGGKKNPKEYALAVESLKQKLADLGGVTGPTALKIAQINDSFKKIGISDSRFQITGQIEQLQKELRGLYKEFKAGEIGAEDFARASGHVQAEIAKLNGGSIVSFTDKIKNLGTIGDSLKNVGSTLTAAISLPIAGAAIAVTKFAADFELAMRQVTSLLGKDAAASFKPLSDGVLELSKRLGIDAVGAAKALYEAISAGVPKENVLAFIEVASKAAIAGVTQTKVAVDGMTTIMNSYRLEAGKAAEVSDAMFQAVNLGKFTFEQLAASMSVAAPIAAQVGVGFKDLLAAAATLTSKGVPVAEAMTQIAAAMRSVISPTKDMEALFAKIGVSSGEALIKSKGLQGALEAIRAAAGGSTKVLSDATGRIEGFNAILSLTGDNAKKAREDLASLNNSVGATDAAFKEIEKSFSRQLDIFTNQAKALGIELGTALLPVAKSMLEAVKPLIGLIGDLAKGFQELPGPVQTAIGGLVGIAAVIGPLLLVAGSLATSVSGLATAFKALSGISSLVGPLQALGGAATAASVGVGLLFGSVVIASVLQTMSAIDDLRKRYKDLADDLERRKTGKQDLIEGGEDNGRPLNPRLIPETTKKKPKPEKVVPDFLSMGLKEIDATPDLKGIAAELNLFGEATKSIANLSDKAAEAQRKLHPELKATGSAAGGASKGADELGAALKRLGTVEEKSALNKLNDDIALIDKAFASKTISASQYRDAYQGYFEQIGAINKKEADAFAKLGKDAEKAALDVSQSFAKAAKELQEKHKKNLEPVEITVSIKDRIGPELNDIFEGAGRSLEAAEANARDLADALKIAGGFQGSLADQAEDLEKAWATIVKNVGEFDDRGRVLATQDQADQARIKALNARILAQRAVNGAIQDEQDELEELDAKYKAIASTTDAYHNAGLSTIRELENNAARAKQALDRINSETGSSITTILTAQGDALAKNREVAIATGQAWDGIDDQLQRVAERLKRATDLKGVSDLQAAFRNFANDAGAAISKSFGDAFDSLIKGDFKGVGNAFKSMWKDVAASAVKDFTDPLKNALATFFGKTVRDLLKGSLSGIKGDLKDLASVIKGLFNIGSSAASAATTAAQAAANVGDLGGAAAGAANAAGGAAKAAGGAASATSGLAQAASIASIANAVATIAAGIGAAFQASETNKTLDTIGRHTLQTANDLANLRKDEWTREGHLMAKLDDIWATARDGFQDLRDAIKNSLSLNLSVGSNTEKAKDLTAAVIASLGKTDTSVSDRLKETNASLRHIDAAIPEWSVKVIAAIEAGTATLLGKLQEIEKNTHSSILKSLFGTFTGGLGSIGSGLSSLVTSLPQALLGGITGAIKGLFGGGKDAGATEVNTRAALAELTNLRSDQWTRHGALLTKLDDIWRTSQGILDGIGGPVITAIESLGNIFAGVTDSLASAIDRLTGIDRETGEQEVLNANDLAKILSEALSDLGNQIAITFAEQAQGLKLSIESNASRIIDALNASVTALATAMGTPISGLIETIAGSNSSIGGSIERLTAQMGSLTGANSTIEAAIAETTKQLNALGNQNQAQREILLAKIGELTAQKGQNDAVIGTIRDALSTIGKYGEQAIRAGEANAERVVVSVESLQVRLAELVQQQISFLDGLPPEIKAALDAGKLAELADGQDDASRKAVAEFVRLNSAVVSVREAITALRASTEKAKEPTANPNAGAQTAGGFDPSQVRTVISPSSAGFDITSYLGAIGALSDRMAGYWERLFEVLAGGTSAVTSSAASDALKITEATASAAQVTAAAVNAGTVSTDLTTAAVGLTRSAIELGSERIIEQTAVIRQLPGFTRGAELFPDAITQPATDYSKAFPSLMQSAYVREDAPYIRDLGLTQNTVIPPALAQSLLPTAPTLYPANTEDWKAQQMDWMRAPSIEDWKPTVSPSNGASAGQSYSGTCNCTITPPPPQLPIQVTVDGWVLAEAMARYHEKMGYR